MIVTSMLIFVVVGGAQSDAAASKQQQDRSSAPLTATGTFSDGATRIIDVTAGDVDGDGKADAMQLHVTCAGATVSSSALSPRDAASGMASGKRQHKPFTMSVTDSRPMAGVLIATYDLKSLKGRVASAAMRPVTLRNVSPAVCGPH